jgi:hypothetical protein
MQSAVLNVSKPDDTAKCNPLFARNEMQPTKQPPFFNPPEHAHAAKCKPLSATCYYGLVNPNSKCCPFNCLLQAWFHIEAFRMAVLRSTSDDVTLQQLRCLFQLLQSQTGNVQVSMV